MLKTAVLAIFLAMPMLFAATTSNNQSAAIQPFAANTTKNCTGTQTTLQWIYSNIHLQLPYNAVYGGYDKNRNYIYVGRAYHNGDYWPASIVPAKRTAYITVNGKVYVKDTFDVLTGDNFTWEMGYDGYTPWGAISTTPNYWIGRAVYKDSLIVGKVSQKQRTCLFSYDNKEKDNSKYEVLVHHGPYVCSCKF